MNELIDWYQFFADNRIKIELYKHSYQNRDADGIN